MKKQNFIITIRYEIPTFSSVGPYFKEGGRGSRKFLPEAEIFGIFSIEVAPNSILRKNSFNPLNREPDSLKALKAPLFEP